MAGIGFELKKLFSEEEELPFANLRAIIFSIIVCNFILKGLSGFKQFFIIVIIKIANKLIIKLLKITLKYISL